MQIVGKFPYVRLRSTKRILDKLRFAKKSSANFRHYGTSIRRSSSTKLKPTLKNTNMLFAKNFSGIYGFMGHSRNFSSKQDDNGDDDFGNVKTETNQEKNNINKPKQVLVLYLPPNSKAEEAFDTSLDLSQSSVVAAIVPADSFTENKITGSAETINIATVNFNNLEPNKVMLVPIAIYENAEIFSTSKKRDDLEDNEEIQENTNNRLEENIIRLIRKSRGNVSQEREVYSFKLPKELRDQVGKVPISALKLELQMEMPNVEKILKNYNNESESVQVKNTESTETSINMFSDIKEKLDGSAAVVNDNFILPLDFKAEISGVLGLNMRELTTESVQILKSADLSNLISAVTGNIASVAFQKTYNNMHDLRTYSTTAKPPDDKNEKARNSPSELFQSYKSKLKKKRKRFKPYYKKKRSNEYYFDPIKVSEENLGIADASCAEQQGALKATYTSPPDLTKSKPLKGSIMQSQDTKVEKPQKDRELLPDAFTSAADSNKHFNLPTSENTFTTDQSEPLKLMQAGFLSGFFKGKSSMSKDDEACAAAKKKESETSDGKRVKAKVDCSQFFSKSESDPGKPTVDCSTPKKSTSKCDVKSDCSSVSSKEPIKTDKSTIQCSTSDKESHTTENKPAKKDSKAYCLTLTKGKDSDKKDVKSCSTKKDSKFDCASLLKDDYPKDKKNSIIDCSPKDKKNSIIDCSPKDKKMITKKDCSDFTKAKECSSKDTKLSEKKDSKLDCSTFTKGKDSDKKGGKQKDSIIDWSVFKKGQGDQKDSGKKSSKDECSSTKVKEPPAKSDSKINCSPFTKDKDSNKTGGDKKDYKINCSALPKGKDYDKYVAQKNSKDEKAPEKKNSKLDCSAFTKTKDSDKKGIDKKDSKIDCSAFGKGKGAGDKSSKDECSPSKDKKPPEKKDFKLDCSAFVKGKDSNKGMYGKDSKIDCSFTKGKIDEKDSGKKSSKDICSSSKDKRPAEKKDSKIDCSPFGKGKDSDKKGSAKKDSKIDCSAFTKVKGDKKDSGKKDSKIDCSAFTKGKGDDSGKKNSKDERSSSKDKIPAEKKDSKIDCSNFGKGNDSDKKDSGKKDSKIDCSSFTKGKSDKKNSGKKSSKDECSTFKDKKPPEKIDSKLDCSAFSKSKDSDKGNDKKDLKIDCSAFTKGKGGKKDSGKKDSKIDCSPFTKGKGDDSKKKTSNDECSSSKDKKPPEKKESKLDCSAFTKSKSDKKGGDKKDSKIDCSAFIKGKGDDSGKKGSKDEGSSKDEKPPEKKGSKIDCSAFTKGKDSNKKGSDKKDSKIDCSAFMKGKGDDSGKKGSKDEGSSKDKKPPEKNGSKIDCSAFTKGKDSNKKDSDKKDSNIDCSVFTKGNTNKKNDSGKKSSTDIKGKGDEKKDSKIDCSAILKGKDGKKDGGKKDSKDGSSVKDKIPPEKLGSKIDCSVFTKGKDGDKKGDKKDEKKEKDGACELQTVKIALSKDVQIEITNAKINKEQLQQMKKLLGNNSKGGSINCFNLTNLISDDLNPSQKKSTSNDSLGTVTLEIEGPASLRLKPAENSAQTKGINLDKSSPFTDGDKKSYCSDSRKPVKMVRNRKRVKMRVWPPKVLNTNPVKLALPTKKEAYKAGKKFVSTPLMDDKKTFPTYFSKDTQDRKFYSTDERKTLKMVPKRTKVKMRVWPPKFLESKPVTLSIPTKKSAFTGGKKCASKPFKDHTKSFSTFPRKTPNMVIKKAKRRFRITSPKSNESEKLVKSAVSEASIPPSATNPNYDGSEVNSGNLHDLQNYLLHDKGGKKATSKNNSIQKEENKVVKVIDCREVCLERTAIPPVGNYDVLIKVNSVGISGSDLYMYETGAKSNNIVTLGHEASGVVEEIGKCVTNLKVGDFVAVEPGVPCGICDFCKRGSYNLCHETIFNGSLAQYCVHPADFCHKLPRGCNLEDGALMHPLALALHACNKACIDVKSNVLIIGACTLGLSAIMCCRAMGAAHVAIVDVLEKNLCIAEELWVDQSILVTEDMSEKEVAECVLNKLGRYGPPNIIINCSGCTRSLNTAIMTLKPGGVCILAGCQSECANFNILETLMKELTIKSSFRTCNMFPLAISLLESCKANVCHLITHRFPLPDVKKAFETALNDQECAAIKVLVKCQDEAEDTEEEDSKA